MAGRGPRAPHTADWAAYTSDDLVRKVCLDAVAGYGCALLRGVPVTPGMVLEVAATFGYVRETNYGKLFDVRVEPDPDYRPGGRLRRRPRAARHGPGVIRRADGNPGPVRIYR